MFWKLNTREGRVGIFDVEAKSVEDFSLIQSHSELLRNSTSGQV